MAKNYDRKFTNRENEIYSLIAEGLNCRQISKLLNITYFTVRKHRSNIITKLGLHGASELVAYAVRTKNMSDLTDPKFLLAGMD